MAINNGYFVMPMNMDRVCRICLQESANLSPIFCDGQNVNNLSDLPQKIQVCGAIECQEQDGLPGLICDVCTYKATIAHEFRQLCQHSDTRLRLYYNKPAKYNATDSGTQTDQKVQAMLTKTAEELQNDYFVKQEAINNQQFHSAIANEEYNPESQTSAVVTTIDASGIPTVDVTIAVEEDDKLFDCHLNFEDQPPKIVDDKSSEVVGPCDTETVTCNQELIPAIDGVCTIETGMSPEDDGVVKNVTYFTYITKDDNDDDDDDDDDDDNVQDSNDLQLQAEDEDDKAKLMDGGDAAFPADEMQGNKFFEPDEAGNAEEVKYDVAEDIKYICEICSKIYNTQKDLQRHQSSHERQFKCDVCSKAFCRPENLEKHRAIHASRPYACQFCPASFSKSQNLAKHLKSHVADKVIVQQINPDDHRPKDETTSSVPALKAELLDDCMAEEDAAGGNDDGFENAPEIFKCDECGQYCSSLKNLKRHALIHGERKYSCTVCKKWFFRPDTLKKHAERHGHGLLDNLAADDNKLYESDDDQAPFPASANGGGNGNDVSKDESEEEGATGGDYKCQHCDKMLATKKGLRRHVALHKPKPEPAACEVCKKVCASRARLAMHQRTHRPKEKVPREYLCHICSKVYPSNSSLTYHMRTHTGVKPHVCKTCNSGFTTTTSLANHIRIHTGDKPFVCHVCSAAFAVSSAFRRHLTRHTGEANYLCKTCGKAFKRLSTLKEHTYTHSGEKPYVCKTCGAAYSHSGSLFAHQKRCRVQYTTEVIVEDHHHSVAHHIHVNNVQTAVRSLAVIGQMF